jgi:protein-S-isoprenylcysteine O-methyltransferase Ste14
MEIADENGADRSASLTRRAFKRLALLLIALAALLFLSAWSLSYWQAWVFLAVFSAAATLITIYFLNHDPALIERRLKAGAVAEKETTQKIIQALAGVLFIALIVFAGLDHRFGWSRLPAWVVLAGDALVTLGLLIVFFVFKENSYASAIIEVGKEQQVISTGPYRIVCHPMYSGAMLMIIGVSIGLGSLWGLLFCIPMAAVIIWRLINEERFLSINLPGYAEYRAKTRYRLIPLIY